jgi:cobalt-zinc-cadmium efflux system membrane fusion protein
VVEDDEVLLGVLGRVLSRAGYDVLAASSAAEALRLAARSPDLALLDRRLPDGDGLALARKLHASRPGLPLILLTAQPPSAKELAAAGAPFTHVLPKPLDLGKLRRALHEVLTEEPMNAPTPSGNVEPTGVSRPAPIPQVEPASAPADPPSHPGHPHDLPEAGRVASPLFKAMQSAGLLLIVGVVLAIFLVFVLGIQVPGMASPPRGEKVGKASASAGPRPIEGVSLVEGKPHTLEVPEQVRASLGIRKGGKDQAEVVKAPTAMRPLTLYGSTALDPARLVRIRARFAPCEVIEIAKVPEPPDRTRSGYTEYRELRPGDRVHKGDVLGVFFSVDVGSKKNDLLDALVQLELDQKILDRAETALNSLPEVFYLNALRQVQGDRNAINRALNNLKVWNIPQEEIDALHEEARKISADKNAWFKTTEGRWVKGEKRGTGGKVDPDRENDNPWGRVTLRAPFEGVIVERNVTAHEMVVDNTVNLFQVAQVRRLLVIANAPEDELPTLNALKPEERVWTVRTVGATSVTGLRGPIEEIGYLIDPNQHTAVIKGYIDNPDEQIRAGQFVSATVRVPPPAGVVEVPIDAVVEDGKYAVVFVQTDPAKQQYTMRRVQLTHRFERTAFVRSKPFAKQEQFLPGEEELGLLPREPLRPGERILRSGVGELKATLLDLESRPARDTKTTSARPPEGKDK